MQPGGGRPGIGAGPSPAARGARKAWTRGTERATLPLPPMIAPRQRRSPASRVQAGGDHPGRHAAEPARVRREISNPPVAFAVNRIRRRQAR